MENLNSVCYVARINEIKPIEGADNIEQGVIGGWNAIIKKGEYKVGGLVVIASTDAVIPKDLSDSMNVTNYLRRGGRVRTVKLRGVYSECLIIPLAYLSFLKDLEEGVDCMDMTGIYKYEPPVDQVQLGSSRKVKYQLNSNFHVYYKFPNLKNVSGLFTEEDDVEITRKLHGTNARYGIVKKTKLTILDKVKKLFGNKWIDYEFVYGSHNVEKGSDSQGYYDIDVWRVVADKYNIRENLWKLFKRIKDTENIKAGIVIYGEIYGAGIQKNYEYGLTDHKFAGFDVAIDGKYSAVYTSYCFHSVLGLDYVPVLHIGKWSQKIQDKFVFNNFIEGSKVPHEGIVIKHASGDRQKVAKVINPDYLIYGEKHNTGDSH